MSSGADPLSALTGGVSLGGDTQPKSRSTVDITADWKLGRKSCSEDKAKEVTAMVAALAMSLSLKVKTLESIAIYRSEIDASAAAAAEAKTRTIAYHNQLMELPKGARKEELPSVRASSRSHTGHYTLIDCRKEYSERGRNSSRLHQLHGAVQPHHEPRGKNQVPPPGLEVHAVPYDVEQKQADGRNRAGALSVNSGTSAPASVALDVREIQQRRAKARHCAEKQSRDEDQTVLKQLGVWKNRA